MVMKARGPLTDILATLYTRKGCSLCEKMLGVVKQHQRTHPFQLDEVDIMAPGNRSWRDLYEYDVPVLHIQKYVPFRDKPNNKKVLSEATKLWHSCTVDELDNAMKNVYNEVEGKVEGEKK